MLFEPFDIHHAAPVMFWMAVAFAVTMAAAVAIERAVFGIVALRQQRLERRYVPIIRRALNGDAEARRALAAVPPRHRLTLAWLLIGPLNEDRSPARIDATRSVAETVGVPAIADRYLTSARWWRRALALRALGLMQSRDRAGEIVGALDDSNADVRAAALDALTDLRDPKTVPAIVVRMHDASLARGRRAAALSAFGDECEPLLLDLAEVDPPHRVNYARALAVCGTVRSRIELCRWARDARSEVRAAAFEALAHVGLDAAAAALALEALESPEALVRTMAARALAGWTGAGDAPPRLGRHLEDAWPVAVSAARSLHSMGEPGLAELRACASRSDLAGLLARQTLWQAAARA
jgi:HEAT repeat protein